MSDLLIKNIELPTEDRIQLSVYPNGKVINHSSFTDTTLLSVVLPPHGMLKDSVAIIKDIKEFYCKKCKTKDDDKCWVCIVNNFVRIIDDAPTVLEASEA